MKEGEIVPQQPQGCRVPFFCCFYATLGISAAAIGGATVVGYGVVKTYEYASRNFSAQSSPEKLSQTLKDRVIYTDAFPTRTPHEEITGNYPKIIPNMNSLNSQEPIKVKPREHILPIEDSKKEHKGIQSEVVLTNGETRTDEGTLKISIAPDAVFGNGGFKGETKTQQVDGSFSFQVEVNIFPEGDIFFVVTILRRGGNEAKLPAYIARVTDDETTMDLTWKKWEFDQIETKNGVFPLNLEDPSLKSKIF